MEHDTKPTVIKLSGNMKEIALDKSGEAIVNTEEAQLREWMLDIINLQCQINRGISERAITQILEDLKTKMYNALENL